MSGRWRTALARILGGRAATGIVHARPGDRIERDTAGEKPVFSFGLWLWHGNIMREETNLHIHATEEKLHGDTVARNLHQRKTSCRARCAEKFVNITFCTDRLSLLLWVSGPKPVLMHGRNVLAVNSFTLHLPPHQSNACTEYIIQQLDELGNA